MKNASSQKELGFTLFEVLLYVALFGLIFTAILQYAMTMTQFNAIARERTKVNKEILFVNEHLRDSAGKSIAINEPQSVFGENVGTIVFAASGGTFRYRVFNNTLYFFDGKDENAITSPLCKVTQFRLDAVRDADDVLIGFRARITLSTKGDYSESRSSDSSYFVGLF